MIGMKRNQQVFYYSNYIGKQPILDEKGFETGEYQDSYTKPIKQKGNISPSNGKVEAQPFGDIEKYDRVIGALPKDIEIYETSRIYIGVNPATESHNYVVKKIAASLNHTSIAISKVSVDGE